MTTNPKATPTSDEAAVKRVRKLLLGGSQADLEDALVSLLADCRKFARHNGSDWGRLLARAYEESP